MRVDQLWRYPVKSVGGEPLTAAEVGVRGVQGDRVVAVHDDQDEVTWAGAVPGLMRVRAVTVEPGVAELFTPDGDRFRSDAADADTRLSAAVDAKVRLVRHQRDAAVAALHILTTTSLRSLSAALPESAIDATRFRPNLVLDGVGGDGFPEIGWIGRRMAIGELLVRFIGTCDRCVMITKQTTTVPHDRAVLRWVAQETGNAFGVYAAVETPGRIRVGDEAAWLD
ncbi:MAG: MOSC domain-containing protein [Micromonosporaceae bacterium]|nr:MOSC domain-containing protein [Micromonosporaceae bacterium]